MLENEPEIDQQPSDGNESTPPPAAPRRRRAASRPAGPPTPAQASPAVHSPAVDQTPAGAQLDAEPVAAPPPVPTQAEVPAADVVDREQLTVPAPTAASQPEVPAPTTGSEPEVAAAEAVQAPVKKAAAKRPARKTAAKKAAAPPDEPTPGQDAVEETAADATQAPRKRAPRKRTAKEVADPESGTAQDIPGDDGAPSVESAPSPEAPAIEDEAVPSVVETPTPEPVADGPAGWTAPAEAQPEESVPAEPGPAESRSEPDSPPAGAPRDFGWLADPFAVPAPDHVVTEKADQADSAHDADSDSAEDEPDSHGSDDIASEAGADDESGDGGNRRRRRRRGGRRRRRGPEDDDSNEVDSSDEGVSETAQSERGHSERGQSRQGQSNRAQQENVQPENVQPENVRSDTDQPELEHAVPAGSADALAGGREGSDESDGDDSEGQRRRRRRRRRRGEESATLPDDPSDVVVRVREPRARRRPAGSDEVTGIQGSTRMEAKRQRRKEGRDAGRRRAPILSEAEFLARRESVNRQMIIRQRPDLAQIAVLEDGILVEHYVDRDSAASLIGNVYLGRVQNVLPSMEAAFVDIGRGRNAVLYAGEVDWDSFGAEGHNRKVEKVLKSGQMILVQVSKDPVGAKGARLTNHVSIPGRYIVYAPGGHLSGISRKLPDVERRRLKDILADLVGESASVIVRTAAEGASEDELVRDVNRLKAQWDDIERKVKAGNSPQLLYGEPDLTVRIVRDLFTEDFAELVIQGNGLMNDAYDAIQGYVTHVAPHLQERIRRWEPTGDQDLFEEYRLDEQIAKALERKVFLPSGGSLVIDRTEAMTVIDVNTGKFTGTGGNLEATVTSNNLEAAEEIVNQLRLRDIGGIIVIDFIDMVLPSNRELLLRRLVECLGRDRTRHQVAEVTSLGLIQMTRKKIGTGLLEAFGTECPTCHGRGYELHDMPVETQKQADGGTRESRPQNHRPPRPSDLVRAAERGARDNAGRSNGDARPGRTPNGSTPTAAEPALVEVGVAADANGPGDDGDQTPRSRSRRGRGGSRGGTGTRERESAQEDVPVDLMAPVETVIPETASPEDPPALEDTAPGGEAVAPSEDAATDNREYYDSRERESLQHEESVDQAPAEAESVPDVPAVEEFVPEGPQVEELVPEQPVPDEHVQQEADGHGSIDEVERSSE